MKKDTQKPTGGNGLRTFDFQGVPIRTLLVDGDTEPWFVASDVAKILGYSNPREAVRTHCKGGREMLTPSKGGLQKTKVIREGDLYRLICNSKLPSAEVFERKVMEEILPSIRRTGSYSAHGSEVKTLVADLAHDRDEAKKEVKRLKSQNARFNELRERRMIFGHIVRGIRDPWKRHEALHNACPEWIPAPNQRQDGEQQSLNFGE